MKSRFRCLLGFATFLFSVSCAGSHDKPTDSGDGDVGASGGSASGGSGGTEAGGSDTGGASTSTGGTSGTGGGNNSMKKTYLYMGSGTWGAAELGKITVFQLDRATHQLTFLSDIDAGGLTSFLAVDEQNLRLFAADEDDGGVLSFSIDAESGTLTSQGARVGTNHPVYLTLAPGADYLLGANYNEGSVDIYPIGDDGVAQAPTVTLQTGENAHSIVLDEQGRALVANKTQNTISRFTYSAGTLTAQSPPTTDHTSPRHIAFDSDGRAYVVSELADTISRYTAAPDGQLTLDFQEKRLPDGEDPNQNSGADIALTPDGSFLYATNRGASNSIVAYDLRGSSPSLIGHVSSGSTTPRKISMDPHGEFLVVGNRESNNITIFDINDDGSLTLSLDESTTVSPYFVKVVEF